MPKSKCQCIYPNNQPAIVCEPCKCKGVPSATVPNFAPLTSTLMNLMLADLLAEGQFGESILKLNFDAQTVAEHGPQLIEQLWYEAASDSLDLVPYGD